MKLAELLAGIAETDAVSLDVAGVTADSRAVKRGDVFVAIPGEKTDGLRYVPQALASGAVAIIAEQVPADIPKDVPVIKVANPRRALALTAAKIFPRQPDVIAAVTGTSGKTSVAAFTRQIWSSLGRQSASIGTVGVVSPKGEVYGSLTTPDPVGLHRTLDTLARDGVTHLALEASSHGLDQHRLDGVRITAGAFTNLSRDHLDYHPSLEAYLRAKLRLFAELIPSSGAAVIDADHEQAAQVITVARARNLRILTIGRAGEGIRLVDAAIDGYAQKLVVEHAGKSHSVRLPLVGGFQIENALVAAGLVIATGGDVSNTFSALEKLKGARGRLEHVGDAKGAPIFVDYAHKPDALAKALEALRPYVKGKLVALFGAGGDRDPGKRPMMGAIAAQIGRPRHYHRRQSPQRKSGGDPRRNPGRGARRYRDRRSRRGDPERDFRTEDWRRSADCR